MAQPDILAASAAAPAPEHVAALPLNTRQRIRLWDAPLRLFHWSLVAAVGVAVFSGLQGGDWMPLHGQAGLVTVGLLAFRLAWGILGSTYARFATFWPTPGGLLAYVRGHWRGVGHNPLGALSVLALLALLGAQVGTGLVGNDEIAFTGPLADQVDEALSLKLTGWHHQLVNALYALVGLHVAAIVFYRVVKKDNLVRPMVTGWKEVDAPIEAPRPGGWVALFVSLAVALAAVYAASGAWVAASVSTAPASLSVPEGGASAPVSTPSW